MCDAWRTKKGHRKWVAFGFQMSPDSQLSVRGNHYFFDKGFSFLFNGVVAPLGFKAGNFGCCGATGVWLASNDWLAR